MTKLSTHIPLEYVKKSKKLREVECEKKRYITRDLVETAFYTDIEIRLLPHPEVFSDEVYPAPTIADIIDNAEELFGEEYRCNECSKIMTKCKDVYLFECVTCGIAHGGYLGKHIGYILITSKILDMCQQDKSIENISKYIINNIK